MEVRPLAQAIETELAAVCLGRLRSMMISRAQLGALVCMTTLPQTKWSMCLGSSLVFWMRPPTAATERPIVSTFMNSPKDLTKGVRAPETITALRWQLTVVERSIAEYGLIFFVVRFVCSFKCSLSLFK